MSSVREIEEAIERLSPDSFRRLWRWMAERESQQWDAEIAEDAASGKFDAIRKRVFADDDAGRTTEL
jgi:hypothetical protein